MACKQHDTKRADYICTTCNNAPICRKCKIGEHSSHTVRTPREVAADITKELITKLKLNDIEVIALCLKEQIKENKEIEKQINLQRGRIHKAVDSIADDLVSLYESKMKQNWDILDKRIEVTTKHRSEVIGILEEFDDFKVINKAGRLVENRMLDFDDLETATYKPGMIDITKLKEMMGYSTCPLPENVPNVTSKEAKRAQHCVNPNIARTNVSASSVDQSSDFVGSVHVYQESEVKERAVFQCSKDLLSKSYAFEIWPTAKRFTWINCADKHKLKLVDVVNGRIEKILKLENHIGGMFVTPRVTDSMLFCCYGDKCIKQVTGPELHVSKAFSTESLYPRCVCRSMKDDDIYVTLVESNDFEITPNSTRCVATFKNRVETCRVEKDKFGDALFVKPSRVKLNKTGDVLGVLNRTDKINNHLVLLNKDLTLKLRYLGNQVVLNDTQRFQCHLYVPETPHTINDFEFIAGDNLIVCELYRRCVELLTADCRHLRTVVQPGNVVPYSLACYADRMWVGYFDGSVKVYDIGS